MSIRGLDDYITGHYGEDQFRHFCENCGATCHCEGIGEGIAWQCIHCMPPCEKCGNKACDCQEEAEV